MGRRRTNKYRSDRRNANLYRDETSSTYQRLIRFGFSDAKARIYIKAVREHDTELLRSLCGKCDWDSHNICPVCDLLRLEEKFKHYVVRKRP